MNPMTSIQSISQIEPIDDSQQLIVIDRQNELIELAASEVGKKIPQIEIKFDLSGRTAGMYCSHKRQRWIRYNPYIFAKYFEENFKTTIPHEVAHYLVDHIYRLRRAPHGKEWRSMMHLLGCEPETTHKFDLEGVPVKRQQRHLYRCSCQEHQLSSTRHNRAQIRGQKKRDYFCRNCREVLIYVEENI
ncbi:MAG: SprT-like domain-containing protein [Gammaproteobacteria bacterium]